MGEHLVLYVDQLLRHPIAQATPVDEIPTPIGGGLVAGEYSVGGNERESGGFGEDEPLIQTGECRICQEEDLVQNLEVPCSCSGTLRYAHRMCVQRWCDEKGDVVCEICLRPYQPGYSTATLPPIHTGRGWVVSGTPLDFHDHRLLAITEAQRRFLEDEHDDYADSGTSGAVFFRSVALLLTVLLLLSHTVSVSDGDADDDRTTFFTLSFLRAVGFLLPCYIMAWVISILHQRRQSREAATQVAFVLQSGQHTSLQFTVAPHPPAAIPQEIVR